MAEFANRRMEDKIPYLEHLKSTGLCASDEIRSVVQNFTNHEYKIQRRERTLDDVLKYARDQMELLELIQARREEQNYFHKKEQIEDVIKTQINSMFGVAAKRFYDNLEFWSARINFVKSQNWPTAVRKNFEEVTKILGKKYPQLWIEASKYEWSLNPATGIDSARTILQLGLRDHPNSEALYVYAFRLEIEFVKFLEENSVQREKIMGQDNGDLIFNQLALAKVIYNTAKENCDATTKDFFFKFFLALQDADTVKRQSLLDAIRIDAEAAIKKENENKAESSVGNQIENDLSMKFQNFQLFFSSPSDAINDLKKRAANISNPLFWVGVCNTLQFENLSMKDWLHLCRIPRSFAANVSVRLWVLEFYSLSGIQGARKWYQKLGSFLPTSLEVDLRMAKIETLMLPVSIEEVKKCYEHAVQFHGRDSIEPWIAYIQFEKLYRHRENAHSILFSRALKELNGELKEHFKLEMLSQQNSTNILLL